VESGAVQLQATSLPILLNLFIRIRRLLLAFVLLTSMGSAPLVPFEASSAAHCSCCAGKCICARKLHSHGTQGASWTATVCVSGSALNATAGTPQIFSPLVQVHLTTFPSSANRLLSPAAVFFLLLLTFPLCQRPPPSERSHICHLRICTAAF
jgi:hypothetical protein